MEPLDERAPEAAAPVTAALAALDRARRSRHHLGVALAVAACPASLQPQLDTLLDLWAAEGDDALVELLRLCRAQPDAVTAVVRARRVGGAVGVAAGLATLPFTGIIGIIIGIAVALVARELVLAWWPPADRAGRRPGRCSTWPPTSRRGCGSTRWGRRCSSSWVERRSPFRARARWPTAARR